MTPVRGRHAARSSGYRVGTLAVTLALAGVLLALPSPRRASPAAPAGPPTVASVWKHAKTSSAPALLPDGTQYSPLLYLDATTAIGTAPSRDGADVRLRLRVGAGAPVELRRLPMSQNPQFEGFTVTGDNAVWAESTATAQGQGQTTLWRAPWRRAGPAVKITTDTGDIVFFNSQDDLVVNDATVYWAAVAHGTDESTEVRSVPLTGGTVGVRTVKGAWALSAWPWLISVSSGQAGPVNLRNLDSGTTVHVPAAGTELVSCSPVWCRALVLSATGGPARFDLMKPDGSQRQRVAGGTASASVQDVALLDRFEVVSEGGGDRTGQSQLYLYDTKRRTLVLVDPNAATVLGRDGMLWWSTGNNETMAWHALDLRSLS